jgi:hypothetical protein
MNLKTTAYLLCGLLAASGAQAETGKLLLTGGVSSIDRQQRQRG